MSKLGITDEKIERSAKAFGFNLVSADEGRLMLLELLVKAANNSYNSHTEECYLRCFGLMKKDRKPNSNGFSFMCDMVYASSNKRPFCYDSMTKFRR